MLGNHAFARMWPLKMGQFTSDFYEGQWSLAPVWLGDDVVMEDSPCGWEVCCRFPNDTFAQTRHLCLHVQQTLPMSNINQNWNMLTNTTKSP